jgi:SAM-dependent methyltransferase
MTDQISYCCPERQCNKAWLQHFSDGLRCPEGHFYPYAPGTTVPVFASEVQDANEYSIANAAEVHDNALRWVFSTFGATEDDLRKRLVGRLHLDKGARVLVTGAGAGNDLPYLVAALSGEGEIYAQDIAKEMLLAGEVRHRAELHGSGVRLEFSVSDAMNLPFADASFDAAYHFGGINLFPDIARGIAEMNRVVRPGGRIVIGDEGIAPWLKDTELGRMLINNNALYAYEPPLVALPGTAREVNLSWELCNCFYVIDYSVSDQPLPVDIDIPHVGKRGGTIRSRYFGRLEGVSPDLRDQVYAEAERRGESRVAYLESVLRAALGKR